MIYVYLSGGLGNQLFQCCFGVRIASDLNQSFQVVDDEYYQKLPNTRPLYFNTMLESFVPYIWNGTPSMSELLKLPRLTDVSPNITSLPDNHSSVLNKGYFQAWLYIAPAVKQFITMLNVSERVEIVRKCYSDVDFNTCIGMHFRRGDYVDVGKHVYHLLTVTYYHNALTYLSTHDPKFKIIYIFCEKPDWETGVQPMVQQLQSDFPQFEFRRSDCSTDWEDMLLMSCCSGLIIGNSSFSYWAGLLPHAKSKTILYPKQWFKPAFLAALHPGIVCHDPKDVCPPEWVGIDDIAL